MTVTYGGDTSVSGSVSARAPTGLTVNKATLTITASNTTNTYGTAPAAPTPIYAGFVNGENSSVLTAQPTCSTTVTATTNVGTPTGTGTCSGAVDANYTITYVAGNATINPATLTVTASAGTMTYGGTPPTVTAHHHRLRQWSELKRDHRPADLLDIGHGHDGRGYRHRR